MRTSSPFAALALGLAVPALLAACETQPYPRQVSPQSRAIAPAVPAATEAMAPAPLEDSEVFLAVRELAQRGATRDLRAAAFRYMDLRFSSGTLGAGQAGSGTTELSAPVKITAEDQEAAFATVVEALRGLPPAGSRGSPCLEQFDQCRAAAHAERQAECGNHLLICAAGDLPAVEPQS